jgi:ABC-type uncharacterized transport system permease subunit
MYSDSNLLAAIGLYTLTAVLLYVSIRNHSRAWWLASVATCFVAAAVHIYALSGHWTGAAPEVGILNLMSLCALVIVLMLCTSAFSLNSLYDASIVALPITIVVLVLEWSIPTQGLLLENFSAGASFHILSSVLAFGVLSIAGVYAFFVAIIDFFLRRHHLNPLVTSLPPLETLERLLFRLIAMGFILLTASLMTGLAYIDNMFEQHLAHKTILSILAWLLFGLLLWGRWRYGWRGRQAVRLTLAGIFLLVLAYFGSKLVLETFLGKSWRN